MANILRLFQKKKQLQLIAKYYNSSDLCPLSVFRQVVNSGELKSLQISGQSSDEELEEAWSVIYDEFSQVIKDKTADLAFLAMKQNTIKRHKVSYLSVLLQAYSHLPTKELSDILIEEGFRVTDDTETTLRMAVGKINRMKSDIEFAEKQNERTDKKAEDFDLVIGEVEKFQGYHFDQDKMSVRHFANIYKRYKDSHVRKN